MNKTLYKQYDSRWGSKPYPTYRSSFAGNGCGCVACTHVIMEQDKYKNLTPEPVRKWMISQGFAIAGQGTTWNGITRTLKHYGYEVTHIGINDPMSKAWKELDLGNRIGVILFLGGKAPNGTVWTAGGHYVAFTDYYVGKDGRHYFYTKDSGGRNHDSAKYGYYSYERSMKGLVYQMWIVEKIGTKKDKTDTKAEEKTEEKTNTAAEPKITSNDELKVDGKFGTKSVKAWQTFMNTSVTGEIGGQLLKHMSDHSGFADVIEYSGGGSALIRAWQKYLKMKDPDGYLGPNTIRHTQKKLGVTQDGIWGVETSKAMQAWLNKRKDDRAPSASTQTAAKSVSTSTSIKKKGIDISAWQGKVSKASFEKAKAEGINYVILRVGYTGSESHKPTLDSCFENNYKNAIAAGLPVGIYYYSRATTNAKAQKEAELCIKYLKDKKITLPVYIDVESDEQNKCSKSTLGSVCNVFCKAIKEAGYKPGVYASLNWFNSKIGTIKTAHSTWVAQYYKKCQYKGDYDIWQYSSSGSLEGFKGSIDMDYCYTKF